MKIQVLDHGYVEFIESWGAGRTMFHAEADGALYQDLERGIIEAARQSTQGQFRSWDVPDENGRTDASLLRYLFSNNHSTPFEFAGLVIEVQAPIFVFREWHRHRTQSYNEMSARYAPLPDLYYHTTLPDTLARCRAAQITSNKQAGATTDEPIDVNDIQGWLIDDMNLSGRLESHYQLGLKIGIPKELARKKMPVDHYSRMRASTNLRNWLAFLTLRADPRAQWEIQQYARAVEAIMRNVFPRTMSLFRPPVEFKSDPLSPPDSEGGES